MEPTKPPITSLPVDHVCPGSFDSNNNNFHFRGTALGGWLVLEPWITPSLFYQFLGVSEKWGDEAPKKVGMDSYTFCTALGDEEANKQLRRHWKTWVTEENISYLKQQNIDTIRIPVGDWMYVPYEPYIGCMDGARDELERVLRLCEKYELKALIDIHAMRGSQNGLDNSGFTGHMQWVTTKTTQQTGYITDGFARYKHWEMRGGDWIGHFNDTTHSYDSVNYTNVAISLDVVKAVVLAHKDDPVVVGLEPVNEPWWPTPIDILKQFYWESYQIVQNDAPHWITVFHDSFRLLPEVWANFMVNCKNYAIDTHIYQAWSWAMSAEWFMEHACKDGEIARELEAIGVPVIVGEWSLATDNCAMWLNGFNDNVPGYPKVECEMVKCPDPYMGSDQPGAPPDPSKGVQDPFGSGGESYVKYGMCPRDKPFENDDEVMKVIGYAQLNTFDRLTHGNFFWNFRTEFEPRWDFIAATKKGWLPNNYDSESIQQISDVCPRPYLELPSNSPSNPLTYQSNYELFMTLSVTMLLMGFYLLFRFINRKRNEYKKIEADSSFEPPTSSFTSSTLVAVNPSYQMIPTKIQIDSKA